MNSYSQSSQDLFVLKCLNNLQNGYFCELGANQPIVINNTYALESQYGWQGVSIEKDKGFEEDFNKVRKSKLICADALEVNYIEVFSEFFIRMEKPNNKRFHYLSLDLEPASITLECLKCIPLDKYRFSVITYEHDLYNYGTKFRDESREIFSSYGYKMIHGDVKSNNMKDYPYEDWWVDPTCDKIVEYSSWGSDFSACRAL